MGKHSYEYIFKQALPFIDSQRIRSSVINTIKNALQVIGIGLLLCTNFVCEQICSLFYVKFTRTCSMPLGRFVFVAVLIEIIPRSFLFAGQQGLLLVAVKIKKLCQNCNWECLSALVCLYSECIIKFIHYLKAEKMCNLWHLFKSCRSAIVEKIIKLRGL